VLVVRGTLEYNPALPFYTASNLHGNGALDYFSFAATRPRRAESSSTAAT